MCRLLLLLLLPVTGVLAQPAAIDSSTVIDTWPKGTRLFAQPNGPFAVLIFPEDALGLHIGVIWYDVLGSVIGNDEPWGLSDRFWQDYHWSADVVNFAWSPDGHYLIVATSEIYNAGAVQALHLRTRSVRQLYPQQQDRTDQIEDMLMPRILGFDGSTVVISVEESGGKQYDVVRRSLDH